MNPWLNDAAADAVATSLKSLGFRRPIGVDVDLPLPGLAHYAVMASVPLDRPLHCVNVLNIRSDSDRIKDRHHADHRVDVTNIEPGRASQTQGQRNAPSPRRPTPPKGPSHVLTRLEPYPTCRGGVSTLGARR